MDTNDKTKCCVCEKKIKPFSGYICEDCGGHHHPQCSGDASAGSGEYASEDAYSYCKKCIAKVPPPLETGGEDEELFGRYRGKLWSKAIQIAMTSPFPEVSMMHVLNRVKQKVEKDILNEILGMKRVAINEKEAISPMGIVSISQGDGHTPPPTYNIRNLQYVKVFDIQKYAEDNDISLSEPLEKE